MPSLPTRPGQRRLRRVFPALTHVLGEEGFDVLAAEALDEAGGDIRRAGGRIHALIVRGRTLPAGVPARLAADLAALEWATSSVGLHPPAPSVAPDVIEAMLAADDWRNTRLTTIPALRLVPVVFRLDTFVRRVERGHRPPHPARRDCWIVVARPGKHTWHLSLPPAAGRLLGSLILDVTLGEAADRALTHGSTDVEQVREHIRDWAWEGLFTQVRRGTPRVSPPG